MKLLFVDDQIELLEIYEEEISYHFPDFEIKTAANGVEALDLCKQIKFDMVFTDGKMPIMDGPEFARQLVQLQYPTHLVLITGHHEFLGEIDEKSLNIQKIILKPISFDGLLSYIKNVVEVI